MKELFQLLLVVTLALLVLFWLLGLLADYLVEKIPFEYEQNLLVQEIFSDEVTDGEVPAYLQDLSRRLAEKMNLPAGMTIQVHYSNLDEVNAFATLGGQLVVFRGLLERLPNENALAMVLAHEIAHIKLRHPLRGLGRGVVLAVAIAALSGSSGNTLGSFSVGEAGLLTSLSFSRDQEQAADAEGLQAVVALYGHAKGSKALFRILLQEEQNRSFGMESPGFLRTHPLGVERVQAMDEMAAARHWSFAGKTTALPAFIPHK
ncbi:MAG: M48 family metallopeptidase [gamma proteobacterium symbiont of Bathyaustriella thionipta]|nr:M48 family metallopeptidase [gamma proteobacterium symbiont of Bathyaustriella thionipta]